MELGVNQISTEHKIRICGRGAASPFLENGPVRAAVDALPQTDYFDACERDASIESTREYISADVRANYSESRSVNYIDARTVSLIPGEVHGRVCAHAAAAEDRSQVGWIEQWGAVQSYGGRLDG